MMRILYFKSTMSFREDEADKVKELVEKSMREAVSLKVPLEVDAHIGKTWLEAK